VTQPEKRPLAVVSDGCGKVFEIPGMEAAAMLLDRPVRPSLSEWIPLPEGSLLFELPGRSPVVYDTKRKRFETVMSFHGKPVLAAAAFAAPAYLRLYLPCRLRNPDAPRLPLYAYAPLGWKDGRFWTTAERVDPDIRHDPGQFEPDSLRLASGRMLRKHPDNRLVRHLVSNCVRKYACPNAQNFVLERWECPLPVSPRCNAECAGCISEQKDASVRSSQDRIGFTPAVRDITGYAVPHLEKADRPIISFGQGCEGEPLLKSGLIEKAIRSVRRETAKGAIHINTNASDPVALGRLFDAGLDSVRVSLFSARPAFYKAYHRPRGYGFRDVMQSLKTARTSGSWISLNYLILPGFTDGLEETEAFIGIVRRFHVDMVQTRNLNMDPDWAMEELGLKAGKTPKTPGMRKWMAAVRRAAPWIRFGYFNPPKEDWGRDRR
jgi:pyruvate-formate lyase-activating enzyme